MNLSKLSVKRPVTVMMLTLIVVILGTVSLSRLPIDLLPKIEYPIAIVSTSYSGVGPQEIENIVTRPIESAVATVSNISSISSITSEGSSIVIAQFNFGTDMNFAALEMREKVDMIKSLLPADVSSPMVMKIDPNAQAIIELSLTNGGDISQLQSIAEDNIKPRLERIEGVASVSVSGGYKNQVEIKVNEQKLRGYNLSLDYIAQIIGAENLNLPGGQVQKGKQELTIRTLGEFKTLDDIKSIPIPLPAGGVVYLRDIAEVDMGHEEITSIAKTNGKNSINISIQKQSGTNTVKVAEAVNKEIEKIKEEYSGIDIVASLDMSIYIKKSIENVANNAIVGGFLAVLILYIFLRNIRTTLIIGTSIPVSIIATFILIYFNDITLNLMTLGGLALGVGMLVDNSIVVLDNIYRFREEGQSRIDAAINGTSEVSMAVTASTLTTIAVFLPIVFVEGITATIFKELALTVTFSLTASLVVSLTLVPMLSSKLLKIDRPMKKGEVSVRKVKLLSNLYDAFDRGFARIDEGYRKILNWSLNHRKATVLIAVAVFAVSMVSLLAVGAEFFPQVDEGTISIRVALPEGAELKDTSMVITEIENSLEDIPEIDSVFSRAGSGGGFSLEGGASNSGSVSVILKSRSERERSTNEVADEIRSLIKDIPGAEIRVSGTSTISFGGAPVSISIKGDELDTLKQIGDDFKSIIESVEGTREVETSLDEGIPEVQIKIDRKAASQYGLTAAQIASAVRSTLAGRVATRYKYDGEELDVIIKGDEMFKDSINNLQQIIIQSQTGSSVPLGQVADVVVEKGPDSISREGQARVVTVTSQITGRDLKSVTDDITEKLSSYDMPDGYSYQFGGEQQELNEAFVDLGLALILAIILVYMIIASQFESLLQPFNIMLSVPLAFAGGALGLFFSGNALSVVSIMGFIMLSGIVVNNAIVLVDYINIRRSSGEDMRQAIVNAGPIRLRPILMTTLTTVLGLIPMSLGLGDGGEIQAPMAVTVIGGLTLSTLLTLVFIPVMYTVLDDTANSIKASFFKGKNVTKPI